MNANNLYGYAGKLLRINLSHETVKTEKLHAEVLRKYMGGVGFAAKLLYDELAAGIDALSPENKLVFATGPLTGTGAPGSGFIEVCFKSPLTGIWAESKCGGEWGGSLKKAGYDFVVIEGKAREPVYITINDGEVEVRPAGSLQGKTTYEKDRLIKEDLKVDDYQIALIGPAGEELVRYANIMIYGRAFGRCGAGAVMGSKNLLAVAVKGSRDVPIAQPEEFQQAIRAGNKKVLEATGGVGMAPAGTTGDIPACDRLGDIPTKNWRSNSWGKGEELYHHFETKNLKRANACYRGCVLRCGRIAEVDSGQWQTPEHEGSEYESIAAFTYFVLNEDMDAAVHATYLCNEYGVDTITAGAAIAFAMDCYESGILGREDVDGLDLSWGNAEVIVELVKMIGSRTGIGRLLGEGTLRAAREIGRGAEALAIHVKGLEGPAHDGRSGKALAVGYGLANRGMCHIHPLEGMAFDSLKNDFGLVQFGLPDPNTLERFDEEGKGIISKTLQDFGVLPDILGICKFFIYNGLVLPDLAGLVSTVTGWDVSAEELLKVGERVYNLQRLFNVREGIRRADDLLPERVCQVPEFGDYSTVTECKISNYDRMLDECYQARGWDKKTGIPTEEKLKELEL